MAQLVANKLKVSYLLGGENAYMWHDHMCQGYTLIANSCWLGVTFTLVVM